MVECHGQKWKKDAGRTKLKPVSFCQCRLKTTFGDYVLPGSPAAKKIKSTKLLPDLFPRDKLNLFHFANGD